MSQRLQKRDGAFSDETKQSTDSIKRFRFMVLGSDDVLINEACDMILRSTDRMDIKQGTCEFKEACVSGRHVSVVKAPTYWLENLNIYLSISNSVRRMKRDMEFCYSLAFPGPHAFLLVLGDVRNSGKEHYILRALGEVFGQEALDYSMVLFMHEYRDSDIGRNRCVRKCRKRFHILKNNEDNVLKLFRDATGTMIKQRKANFFTKDFDLLDKAEAYFKKEFDAKYEELERRLRGDLAERKTTEENLRTKMTEMEKQTVRELQDLREELDAQRARENQLSEALHASISRENQLSQQMDALKKKKYELKEELYAHRYNKRQVDERESQLKSKNEKLQRELEQLKGNEKKLEKNPRESKDIEVKIQLEHNRLQEQKEVQAPAQEEHDRPRASDRREVELDERNRKLLQTVSGSQPGHHISTAVTPPGVSEDNPKPQEDTGPLDFEGLKLVRVNSKKLNPPDVSENKVKPLSERECEIESKTIHSQSSRSIEGEGLKPVRQNSMQDPPYMSEDKSQEDTGYLEFEGLKLVRENSKELDPPDGYESNLQMSGL